MAKFRIDEAIWVSNYPNMITVRGFSGIRLIIFILLFSASIVVSFLLKQYLGVAFLVALFVIIVRRYWFDRKKAARKAYRSTEMASSIQEVRLDEDSISVIFGGSLFNLDWQGLVKVIYLPELIYVKHKLLHFYILASSLSENELGLFQEKLEQQNIKGEDRKKTIVKATAS